ncbi:ATP-NAD kinase family protein [Anaerotignum sp.]|uniref:ATP-NAD kinase family protein n=1 Tax=Anaerotignum sp. TaxID=2039241 RepID=UPI002714B329|nr:NAD(+)/NADH kinase [Anaerotignum sp.]
MSSIGIIANPASGKDIRRLVSYATTIDNQEKVNIVKRIILAAQSLGVDSVWIMPDTFQMGFTAISDLSCDEKLHIDCRVMDIPLTATSEDTTRAAAEMEKMGVGCVIVLGGDGTSRAVAKGLTDTPLLPLSTGTNNVYPTMVEGTVAGMAAAGIALMPNAKECCTKDKRIEIYKNGSLLDIALIDAVITDDLWVGAKAIWDAEKLKHIFVTRCHPASIGFSSAAGCIQIVEDNDPYGLALTLGENGEEIIAPIAAGFLASLNYLKAEFLPLGTPMELVMEWDCMVALDGERELRGKKGDRLAFAITQGGPWRVQIKRTLEKAVEIGLFKRI